LRLLFSPLPAWGGANGLCRARQNQNGKIVCINYGVITAMALDPIEKKPLACFYPGSRILSVGSFGCNLRCPFCQNSAIAAAGVGEVPCEVITPEELVENARRLGPRGNIGVAYTYNEPLVGYEFVRDCAALVHEAGLKNVLVTNGTLCEAQWAALLPLIDAANIDLKGFTQDFYDFVGGDLQTVKGSIAAAVGRIHVEVTTLIIPGKNDSTQEWTAVAWLAGLDENIPLHISRFFPRHRLLDLSPPPLIPSTALCKRQNAILNMSTPATADHYYQKRPSRRDAREGRFWQGSLSATGGLPSCLWPYKILRP
jgi:pyruvate formate lyase activating enzyme